MVFSMPDLGPEKLSKRLNKEKRNRWTINRSFWLLTVSYLI